MKLDDLKSHDLLKQVAVGRTAREMGNLLHIAHEELQWESERAKHAALPKGPDPAKGTWAPLQDHLLDGEGSNHIDIALGLAVEALLLGSTDEFEFKLRGLFKACAAALPHVKQQIIDSIVDEGRVNSQFPKRLIPPPVAEKGQTK